MYIYIYIHALFLLPTYPSFPRFLQNFFYNLIKNFIFYSISIYLSIYIYLYVIPVPIDMMKRILWH